MRGRSECEPLLVDLSGEQVELGRVDPVERRRRLGPCAVIPHPIPSRRTSTVPTAVPRSGPPGPPGEVTWADYVARRDPVLEAALKP